MSKIIRGKETLSSKERIKRTFAFEPVDRVAMGLIPIPLHMRTYVKHLKWTLKRNSRFCGI